MEQKKIDELVYFLVRYEEEDFFDTEIICKECMDEFDTKTKKIQECNKLEDDFFECEYCGR